VASDWKQVDRLLEAALEREPRRRADFLIEACGGDESLRREVESLLAAHVMRVALSIHLRPILRLRCWGVATAI
jgi:hypothetical protein